MFTAGIIHRWWNDLRREHFPNRPDGCFYEGAQSLIELNLPPPSRTVVKDRAARNRFSGHLFEAYCLGAELKVVVLKFSQAARLILYREGDLSMELNDIRFSDKSQAMTPQRKSPLDTDPFFPSALFRRVGSFMQIPSAHGINIFLKRLLHMNQRAATRTVGVLVEGGDGNSCLIHAKSPLACHSQPQYRGATLPYNQESCHTLMAIRKRAEIE